VIVFVMPKVPAAKVLKAGDVVEAVDGRPTHGRASAVGPYVRKLAPGQIVHLTLLRGKRVLHVAVRTVAAPGTTGKGKKGQALVGIYVQDRLVFPVNISINSGSIGGPSAGLQFTLGIIERLEHKDLTKGCKVAGTGTIDAAGNVGAIGGARQKIVAAGRAGARYFFVPDVRDQDNLLGALSARGHVTVVPVKTLHQALTYLSRLKPCR
jgi:PDZ domain-containing protein